MIDPQPTTTSLKPVLLRIEDAAHLLSLSRSKVYELLSKGELPVVKFGRARRIPLGALHAWIDANTEYRV